MKRKEFAVQNISCGLFVLSSRNNDKDAACIINTLMQVTNTTPASCIVAVNKQSLTHDFILASGIFNVSILSSSTSPLLVKHFGYQSGHNVDKFIDYKDFSRSKNGLIYTTEGTNSFLSFAVSQSIDLGMHTLFIGLITQSEVLTSDASITYEDYQNGLKPAPEASKENGFRCTVCDYFYEGSSLPDDYICPICQHGVDVFVYEEK